LKMTSFSISANFLQTEPLEITHQFTELCTPRIHLDVEGNPTVTSDEQVEWFLHLLLQRNLLTCKLNALDVYLSIIVVWFVVNMYLFSSSSYFQVKVESTIEHLLETFLENHELDTTLPRLNRLQIVDFVRHGLSKLSTSYEVQNSYFHAFLNTHTKFLSNSV
jgi:hypothetical protein